jgi:protoheme IX farnesyltransferase
MMQTTKRPPLPAGRMSPRGALIFATAVSVIGTAYLVATVNVLTAVLGAVTLSTYIFVYTPLKRVSTLCTIIGAIPGAIPPMMGWAAARGSLGLGAWIAFAILFLWQMPHFMAISWMYRDDYARAGFEMVSVHDTTGRATARQAILYSLALIAASLTPWFAGLTGPTYAVAAATIGTMLLFSAVRFYHDGSRTTAARLFMASNLYLIAVMTMLVVAARAIPHAAA